MAAAATLLIFLLSVVFPTSAHLGINYGQFANNLPSPPQVAALLQSININRIKLYDANPIVLSALANTNTDTNLIIGLPNEHLSNITSLPTALQWIETHVQPYIPLITSITVGNEILTSNDTTHLITLLLPAMQTLYSALITLNLSSQVSLTTPNSIAILASSFPPSSGYFRQDLAGYIQQLLNFHSITKSPFLINAYPFFAYKSDPARVDLDYALFRSNPGMTDPVTGLHYDNMLYAQIDAVYSSIKAMGHEDIEVCVSETGWPSRGDDDEVGATPENAATYNGNLVERLRRREGTPANPNVPIDVYLFALFNEDLKTGPTSERNYGLFYPDESPVYNVPLMENGNGNLPVFITTNYSSPHRNKFTGLLAGILLSLMLVVLSPLRTRTL